MLLRKKLWLLVCLMMVLAGCAADAARGGSPPAKAPSGGFANESAPTTAGDAKASPSDFGGSFQPGQPAPPPPAPGKAGSTNTEARHEAPQDSRPGLGTEYGEACQSRVHDVTFVRDSSRPFAIASMNYNDRKGVDAQANAAASRENRRDVPVGAGAVTVSIKDANGSALEAVRAGGKTFVIGQAGQRYSIVLQNHTSHRFEAVATVDGLDVINGKAGSFDNRGYVLMPFATLEIEGFRQSTQQVAAFRFAAVGESYAAQMGNARNVGVIGVAFFTERGDNFVSENELKTRDTASPFPADPRFAPPPPGR